MSTMGGPSLRLAPPSNRSQKSLRAALALTSLPEKPIDYIGPHDRRNPAYNRRKGRKEVAETLNPQQLATLEATTDPTALLDNSGSNIRPTSSGAWIASAIRARHVRLIHLEYPYKNVRETENKCEARGKRRGPRIYERTYWRDYDNYRSLDYVMHHGGDDDETLTLKDLIPSIEQAEEGRLSLIERAELRAEIDAALSNVAGGAALEDALMASDGNICEAARILGEPRSAIRRRVNDLRKLLAKQWQEFCERPRVDIPSGYSDRRLITSNNKIAEKLSKQDGQPIWKDGENQPSAGEIGRANELAWKRWPPPPNNPHDFWVNTWDMRIWTDEGRKCR